MASNNLPSTNRESDMSHTKEISVVSSTPIESNNSSSMSETENTTVSIPNTTTIHYEKEDTNTTNESERLLSIVSSSEALPNKNISSNPPISTDIKSTTTTTVISSSSSSVSSRFSTSIQTFLGFFTRQRLIALILLVLLWSEFVTDENIELLLEQTGLVLPSWLQSLVHAHSHSYIPNIPYEVFDCAAPIPTILPEIYLARSTNPSLLTAVDPTKCQIYQDVNKEKLLINNSQFFYSIEYLFLLDTTLGPNGAGGTYFEGVLYNNNYRTRIAYHDQLDGTYKLSIFVPNFEWLGDNSIFYIDIFILSTKAAAVSTTPFSPQLIRSYQIQFVYPTKQDLHESLLPSIPLLHVDVPCNHHLAYSRPIWDGYWIRLPLFTDTVNLQHCKHKQFCQDTIGVLEEWPNLLPQNKNQHWFYRLRHCYFPLRTPIEVRQFYNGKWIMWFGDSNAPDTIRDIADHGIALTRGEIERPLKAFDWRVPFARRHDAIMQGGPNAGASGLHITDKNSKADPKPSEQTLEPIIYRSMSTFNGAVEELDNHFGGRVYQSAKYKNEVRNQWSKDLLSDGFLSPHMVVFNDASLHMRWAIETDGLREYKRIIHNDMLPFFQELHDYATNKVQAVKEFLMKSTEEKEKDTSFPSNLQLRTKPRKPRWIYRSTVVPAGPARMLPANPHKIHYLHHLLSGILARNIQSTATSLPCSYANFPDYTQIHDAEQRPVLDPERDKLVDPNVEEPYWDNVVNSIAWSFVDMNDITHPWHYNLDYSDGGHYGREFGNYMVDDMWGQILLHWMIMDEHIDEFDDDNE